jgi:predicted DNA-binding transcriptional regulator YafY
MAKADNMLAILMLLRSRRGRMTARQLAEELEIHIHTVYRCIDALCASGVPIVAEPGRDGGYSLPEHVKLDPLFFDADEQKALLHAARLVRDSGYPREAALDRAIAKIKRYADAKQRARLEAAERQVEAVRPPADNRLASTLAELEQAASAQVTLELEYAADYDGPRTRRRFDPYGIVHWKDRWYAVGWCHLRGAIRSFRADRILRLRSTGEPFERPEHFSPRQYLTDSLLPEHAGSPDNSMVEVRIAGSPGALDDLCAHWLFARVLTERTPELAVFRLDEHSSICTRRTICFPSAARSGCRRRGNSGSVWRTSPNRCCATIASNAIARGMTDDAHAQPRLPRSHAAASAASRRASSGLNASSGARHAQLPSGVPGTFILASDPRHRQSCSGTMTIFACER